MKLNQNSLSARLYRWFYLTDSMPQNLCPYFWKLVIMWIIIIPYGLVTLPAVRFKSELDGWSMRFIGGAFMWLMIFAVFVAIFPLTYFIWGWFDPKSTFGAWQITGIFIWVVTAICLMIWGIMEFIQRRKEKSWKKHVEYIWNNEGGYVPNPEYVPYTPKPNIIIEFIKAKYNKYCPTIEWTKK